VGIIRENESLENDGMGMQNGVIGFVVLISSLALASGDNLVEPLVVKNLPAIKIRGNVRVPYRADSKEEVAKLLGPQQAENIEKQMSFETHRVLLFQWAGSGQDALVSMVHDKVVTFRYTRGRTRDLRQHLQAFSVDRQMAWEVTE
jgi:hypothetical protein